MVDALLGQCLAVAAQVKERVVAGLTPLVVAKIAGVTTRTDDLLISQDQQLRPLLIGSGRFELLVWLRRWHIWRRFGRLIDDDGRCQHDTPGNLFDRIDLTAWGQRAGATSQTQQADDSQQAWK